ncbi:musculoskeletal embryonic nuclear protein 1a isoform X1 [Xyrauchen texanus]|uniref:musculoskeletal embryonic nuclear protein 1a isoform X1 n=1 Tax=Xyrauchen texanus TaxID=154827 RepID=UPI0022427DF2|nr:musculoskeletal embryonic nuclear protein 1a isoform X1 [Xyrauchen texanus]
MAQQGKGAEGTVKRPLVKAEDLTGAKDNLHSGTEVKSKTFEVMQECELGRSLHPYSVKFALDLRLPLTNPARESSTVGPHNYNFTELQLKPINDKYSQAFI